MTSRFGSTLQRHRKQRALTQAGVAEHLGVERATVAQWEGGRHLPEPEKVRRLDDLLGARGELVGIAAADRGGTGDENLATPPRNRSLALVLQDVADALVRSLIKEDATGRALGWGHDLKLDEPTPLSTAFVIRTLQLLDDARVDLHALGEVLQERRVGGGWRYHTKGGMRPEVTGVVLAALSRLGLLTDVPGSLDQLEGTLDAFARSRPYVLSVVLESALAIRPDAPLVTTLVRELLRARTTSDGILLWAADAGAAVSRRVEPSVAHTARATAVLRTARSFVSDPGIDDAIETATSWIVARNKDDDGMTEVLRPVRGDRTADVPINHFTAAWCVRAFAGADGIPATRVAAALDIIWNCYSPGDSLWVWGADGTLPSWMTHDAVAALRAFALSSAATPISWEPIDDPDSDPDAT